MSRQTNEIASTFDWRAQAEKPVKPVRFFASAERTRLKRFLFDFAL